MISLLGISLYSCIKNPTEHSNDYQGNFDALWNIIDTRYCYLEYKGIDWNYMYEKYNTQVNKQKTDMEFFDLLSNMLAELQDGHVNLYSSFNTSRYWNWYMDYPSNFDSDLIYSDKYLGTQYKIAGGFNYEKIDSGRIGYMYYGDFTAAFSNENIAYIFEYFKNCSGLIIDVRDNGGGSLDLSEQLASYFFSQTTHTGYICHKTGSGHSDFSKPSATNTMANVAVQWKKPVAILTNRMSFSATNDFVNRMKNAPKSIIIGDKTGGGGGMPFSSELPNGWMIRFSACPMFDLNMNHIEWGIDPDMFVNLDPNSNSDAIIDTAISQLK